MHNRFFLFTRLIALLLLAASCVWTLAPLDHVRLLADHHMHVYTSFIAAQGDLVHAQEAIQSILSAAQQTFGISHVNAAELPSVSDVVDSLPALSTTPTARAGDQLSAIMQSTSKAIQSVDLTQFSKVELPEIDASEAADYVGSKFGRIGSNFVKMSGLNNAPQTADTFMKQSSQMAGDFGKQLQSMTFDIPSIDTEINTNEAMGKLVDGTIKRVTELLPKEIVAAQDPEVAKELASKVGTEVAKKAEEAARAADASIKYWLDEASRTNEAAVKKVNFQLPSLPTSEDLAKSFVDNLPKPVDPSTVQLKLPSMDSVRSVKASAPSVDVTSVAQATGDAVKSVATVAVGVGGVVGQAALGTAVVAGQGALSTITGVAKGTAVVVGGTAKNVGAFAAALVKSADALKTATPDNINYIAEKTSYLTHNAASGFQALGKVLQSAPSDIEKFVQSNPVDTTSNAQELFDKEVAPQVNTVLSDWGSRLSRVGDKFVKQSGLDVATDAAVRTTQSVVQTVQTELPKVEANLAELKKQTNELAAVAKTGPLSLDRLGGLAQEQLKANNVDADGIKDAVAKKAEEAARAADASIKYWLDEASRTNEAAVKKVSL